MVRAMTFGVVAVGDSIINGGTLRDFTTPQSWAQHLAEAGDWPFTKYARGGATSAQVVTEQLPRITRTGYDVGAVTVGANDLLYGWNAAAFGDNLATILEALAGVADRVVISNVPDAFRRLPGADPRINGHVPEANAIIAEQAARCGAFVVDVRDFSDARWFHPDRVHPTALGLVEMGQRAAAVLDLDRAPVDTRPLPATYWVRVGGRYARTVARVSAKRALVRARR